MKLAPFFRYFGAKAGKIKRYPAPKFNTIVEPFAGSASYACAYPNHNVHLYDASEYICGVWQYLIGASESEILALPDVFIDSRYLNICQEAKWLLGYCVQFNGVRPLETAGLSVIIGHPKSAGCVYWNPMFRARIASQLQYIRHWKITHCEYTAIDCSSPASWFVDPPYQHNKHRYTADVFDYNSLADWVHALQGQIIVCENQDASWLPFQPLYEQNHTNGKGKFKEAIYHVGQW